MRFVIPRELILEIIEDHEGGLSEARLCDLVNARLWKKVGYNVTRTQVREVVISLASQLDIHITPNGELSPAVNTREKFLDAIRRNQEKIIHRFLENGTDTETLNAGLVCAVITNRVEVVRHLLAAGADPKHQEPLFGKTPAMFISSQTSSEIIHLLQSNEYLKSDAR
jgi:hypothetical protein